MKYIKNHCKTVESLQLAPNTKLRQACLVKRTLGGLGDLLMLTPALKSLSKKYDVDLQISDKYYPLFENSPYISKMFSKTAPMNESLNKHYKAIYDLNNYEFNYEQIYQPTIIKTKQQLFAEALGVSLNSLKPIIKLTKAEELWAQNYLHKFKKSKVLILSPKSANPTRDWPLAKWKELLARLKSLDYLIIIADQKLHWPDKSIIFFNKQPLRRLFALVSKADFVVAQDSGLLHVAAAFNKPTLAIFGPTDPKLRCVYKKASFIALNLFCSPCWYERCTHLSCLNMLSVDMVETAILEALENDVK